MTATMLARAVAAGLIDKPPLFALSRVYSVLATGAVTALLDPQQTVVTISYGPGQPALPLPAFPIPGGGSATAQGLDDLEPDRFSALALATTLFTGLFAPQFFSGLAGMVEYLAGAITFFDAYTPTGNGAGNLGPGGLVLNPDGAYEAMVDAARAAGIMVVQQGVHVGDPAGTITDPTTQLELGVGDLFSQAEILLRAVASALSAELLFGRRVAIPVVGAFQAPPVPPVVGVTLTAVVL